ncbi:unnamed protein product [Urochloa humidicola]
MHLLDGLLVRAEEKRVENLIHHHVIHYHLHFQRRKLIRLEMMDRWPYQLQMALADIVPHLRDKGRKDSLKIRDEIADSLVELHKDCSCVHNVAVDWLHMVVVVVGYLGENKVEENHGVAGCSCFVVVGNLHSMLGCSNL